MELNQSQFKQPHQMSPDEFALHPNAIFHGTWLPDSDVFNLNKRTPESGDLSFQGYETVPKIHLGTFAAALHRLHDTNRPTGSKTATVHTFWQTPHVSDLGGGVRALNDSPEDMAHYIPGSMWYSNQNEDDQNPSFATEEPQHTLKSQADYVKNALANGKGSEVHPETLKRYKSGTLGKLKLNNDQVDLMYEHLYWPVKDTNKYALGAYTKAGPTWDSLNEKGLWKLHDPSYEYDDGKWTI
jgi:hypothetical protein